MGLRDDIIYTTVELPVECYPRIKHFQSELQELFLRFQRIYETLPESVVLSAERIGSISNSVQNLINSRPTLFMFGPRHSKIPKEELVHDSKPVKFQTNTFEKLHQDGNANNSKIVLAMCTLKMMDSKGQDALRRVIRVFGVENMMFYVDKEYEHNLDMLANTLADLENVLKLKKDNLIVVYESKKEIISNAINNYMERKFAKIFVSFNKFLLELTKKRSRTRVCTFGDTLTGRRYYKEVIKQFENVLTVTDLLVTSKGESTEQKLATAIVDFTTTLLIRDIAETYEIQDVKVFDYFRKENYSNIWISYLQKRLHDVPLVKKFDQFVRMPNDESVKRDIEKHYTRHDARTIGKEVTKVLMGYFLQVGTRFKTIRVNLDLLIYLRKELQRLIEETIDGDKYVERVRNLEHWRKLLLGNKDVQGIGLIHGKFVVLVQPLGSTERQREVLTQVERSLKGFPTEVVVECVSPSFFAGRHETGSNSKIVIGDGYLSERGKRGTIGLFMHEYGDEHRELYFITSSHVVLDSTVVKTNDQNPVLLGKTRDSLFIDNGLVDIAAIRIEESIQDRCNIFFKDNDGICKCSILDMNAIQNLKEGQHVYKRGSTTGETKGCIISEDFRGSGLKDHNFLVGLPAGSDETERNKGFAQEGDSGAVLYSKTPDGEVQFIALLMGKFDLREKEEKSNLTFKTLTSKMGSLTLTTCLREGLDRIENKFKLKLNLPTL